jgi:cardiolipin synthase
LPPIGTANFDNRSFRLNFEITVAIVDEEFAARVKQMLEDDFAGSKLITTAELASRGWWFHLSSRIARLMAPVQ